MANGRDMTAPVTRGELHEALELWAKALLARIDELAREMRALVKTSETEVIDRVTAMFDPYRSLPERVNAIEDAALPDRVSRLEAKVFAPKRRASKSARRRT